MHSSTVNAEGTGNGKQGELNTGRRSLTQAKIDRVTAIVNHRPRKALDYRTPSEVSLSHSGTG